MTDAREIIARHLCTMAAQGWSGISAFERAAYRNTAAGMVEAIHDSGFRILGPDEIDGPTVEKCAEEKQAVITLLYTDEVFVGSHWEDYPNAGAGVWPTLCAHVSSYGSDAEEIPESEIAPLARLVDEYGRDAVQAWVCHRRGNERPSKGQLTDAGKAALRALKEKGK